MRQRKAKDMEARLESCSDFMVKDPSPEEWERCFRGEASADGRGAHRKLYLEIGCGKGQFIIQNPYATRAPDPKSGASAVPPPPHFSARPDILSRRIAPAQDRVRRGEEGRAKGSCQYEK